MERIVDIKYLNEEQKCVITYTVDGQMEKRKFDITNKRVLRLIEEFKQKIDFQRNVILDNSEKNTLKNRIIYNMLASPFYIAPIIAILGINGSIVPGTLPFAVLGALLSSVVAGVVANSNFLYTSKSEKQKVNELEEISLECSKVEEAAKKIINQKKFEADLEKMRADEEEKERRNQQYQARKKEIKQRNIELRQARIKEEKEKALRAKQTIQYQATINQIEQEKLAKKRKAADDLLELNRHYHNLKREYDAIIRRVDHLYDLGKSK